jgi:hypothetical protein
VYSVVNITTQRKEENMRRTVVGMKKGAGELPQGVVTVEVDPLVLHRLVGWGDLVSVDPASFLCAML